MSFLHSNDLVHYDLKPENSKCPCIKKKFMVSQVLLDESFNPVIADFGLSRVLELEDMLGIDTTVGGTLWYMAPELLQVPPKVLERKKILTSKKTVKCDVYAFAFICYELWLQERFSWGVHNPARLLEKILSGERPSFVGQRTEFPPSLQLLIKQRYT